MIKFYSFLEALRYRPKCPLCSKEMEVNDRDLVDRVEYPLGHPYQKFSFSICKTSNDIMVLHPHTEEVEVKYIQKPDFNYSGTTQGNYTLFKGVFYQALTINCNSCCQYHFTLQIHADLTEGRLIGT